jgi:ornithine carbamoyltransferase
MEMIILVKMHISTLKTAKKIESQLKGRDLLTLLDYSSEEIDYLLQKALMMKKDAIAGKCPPILQGKTLGMIFEKHSTRTRISFEVGMVQLGGHAMYMNANDLQIGRGESVYDTGNVLSGYLNAVMIRANSHEMVKELAKHSSIPVINGLTDMFHPCQALADLLTIIEVKGSVAGKRLAYVGDGNNVAHSLVIGAVRMGMHVAVATPKGFEFNEDLYDIAQKIAEETGGSVMQTYNPVEAVKDADVVYTDVWTSMGQEEEAAARLEAFKGFQVNDTLVANAKKDFMFLHCLPAHREEEVATSVIDGPNSYVFQQAENRLHAQKAVLAALL